MKIEVKANEYYFENKWVMYSKNSGFELYISKRSKYLKGMKIKEGDKFTIDLKKK